MKKLLTIAAFTLLFLQNNMLTSEAGVSLNVAMPMTENPETMYEYTATGMKPNGIIYGDYIINTISLTYYQKATSGTIVGYTKDSPTGAKGQTEVYNMLEDGLTKSSFNTSCGFNALGCCGDTIAYKTADEGWLWNFTYTPGDWAWDPGKVAYTKYPKLYGTKYDTSDKFKKDFQDSINIELIDDKGNVAHYNPLQLIAKSDAINATDSADAIPAAFYTGINESSTRNDSGAADLNLTYIGAYIKESISSTTGLTSQANSYVYGQLVGESVYEEASNKLNYTDSGGAAQSVSL